MASSGLAFESFVNHYLIESENKLSVPKCFVVKSIDLHESLSAFIHMGVMALIIDDVLTSDTTEDLGNFLFTIKSLRMISRLQAVLISLELYNNYSQLVNVGMRNAGFIVYTHVRSIPRMLDLVSRQGVEATADISDYLYESVPDSLSAHALRDVAIRLCPKNKPIYNLGVEHETVNYCHRDDMYLYGHNLQPYDINSQIGLSLENRKFKQFNNVKTNLQRRDTDSYQILEDRDINNSTSSTVQDIGRYIGSCVRQASTTIVNGQMKLMAADGPLFSSQNLLYIGGAPCYHALWYNQIPANFVIIDPNPMAPQLYAKGVTHIPEEFKTSHLNQVKDGQYNFILDIRSDRGTKEQITWWMMVDHENILTSLIFWFVRKRLKVRHYSVKNVPGINTFPLVPGRIIFLPFQNTITAETRIYDSEREHYLNISIDDYLMRIKTWTRYRMKSYEVNRYQQLSMVTLYVNDIDMRHVDISKGTFLALWSISNTRNKYSDILSLFSRGKGIALVPLTHTIAYPLRKQFDFNLRGKDYRTNLEVIDYKYHYMDFVERGLYVTSALKVLSYYVDKFPIKYCPSSDVMLWYFISTSPLLPFPGIDTIWNSITQDVRVVTTYLRWLLAQSRATMHEYRLLVLHSLLPAFRIGVSGFDNLKIVEVGGHLLNLLISSLYIPVDFNAYMDVVSVNIRGGSRRLISALIDRNLMAERPKSQLQRWHSKRELLLAIKASVLLMKRWGLELDPRVINYVFSRVKGLKGNGSS